MFTVGEFSQVAQVSKRLLRYYDEIGLLRPVQTDSVTGYRYYSAEQMPQLNRILALKDLGLSLDQIHRILKDNISTDEINGMLLLKKAEIEHHIEGELTRIRNIESRLHAIRIAEAHAPINVVMKNIAVQPVLSVRSIVSSFSDGIGIFNRIRNIVPAYTTMGFCFCMCHNDGIVDLNMDLEIGCHIEGSICGPIVIDDELMLTYHQLPAVPTMATIVVKGALETIHTGYTEIGLWAETNRYRIAGAAREITLQTAHRSDGSDLITEIQFPVKTQT